MKRYSQHELDTKIHHFMKRKMHQFPDLRLESAASVRPVEKHQTAKRSHLFPSLRLSSQY
jgi:hypothetical protein